MRYIESKDNFVGVIDDKYLSVIVIKSLRKKFKIGDKVLLEKYDVAPVNMNTGDAILIGLSKSDFKKINEAVEKM